MKLHIYLKVIRNKLKKYLYENCTLEEKLTLGNYVEKAYIRKT